ncbi:MAG TPA: hypothetical protein VNO70_04155 [Blastocatellia bacterium]|nr:hypothetical protein [Blastocatellia bacterium]
MLALISVGIGAIGAFTWTRSLSSPLFEISPTGPFTSAGVSLSLAVVTLLACCVPARRTMRVDPMAALRYE